MHTLSSRLSKYLGVLALAAATVPTSMAQSSPSLDSNAFGALRARAIGPAVMSGRISSIDVAPGDPLVMFVGSASGGVWRSKDAGTTFEPIFDDHIQSIGAVRVAPSDHDVVWVGTGESWVRNSVSYGDGVYKSTDGGDNFTHMGLSDSERVGAIRIHPENADVVYVCATGHLFDDHPERGVYRTTDGGESWDRVLYVDEKTGCADIDIDPQEPDILYAGMWQFRRSAHFFESGGPGSGLYRTMDGGDTWEELERGLPESDLGRIAVAVAPSRPNVVYATVESAETALYRSDDLGSTWRQVNASQNVQMRPFYFGELVIDPTDHDRVYKPSFTLTASVDGGESFSSMLGGGFSFSVHPAHHALWINPDNPHQLVLGTDGGVYISNDRSESWGHVRTLPVSQFYQVATDMEMPYNVYGGLQDNGSWMGPSRKPGGIKGGDWQTLSYGDGFWVLPDPTDSNTVYSESQGGNLFRADKTLGIVKSVFPYSANNTELRFNWNTPMHISPTRPEVLYYGSQFLHRSLDRGETWETISPDLTTNDPAKQRQKESGGLSIDNSTAENHTTIYTIAESPLDAQVIWVGTDDGHIQLTRDGGKTWVQTLTDVAGVAPNPWVTSIHASGHDAATAFATFDHHFSGDMRAYVYKTDDFGATWQPLHGSYAEGAKDVESTEAESTQGEAADSAINDVESVIGEDSEPMIEGYAHKILQDPKDPDLLFLGTELGLWISIDGGQQWARFEGSVPPVAVHDILVHPRDDDLVVGTHGRGVFILDDLGPLRALSLDDLNQDTVLLPSPPAEMMIGSSFAGAPEDEFVGEVPAEAAVITYYLKKRHLFGDLKIEIFDANDKLIASLPGGKRRGLNRVAWAMRYKAPKLPPATNLVPAFTGPRVPEGVYKVKLTKGKKTFDGEVELVPDPRAPFSQEDRQLQQTTAMALYDGLEQLSFLIDSLKGLHDGLDERMDDNALRTSDRKVLKATVDRTEALRRSLVSTSDAGWLSGDEKLREKMGNLFGGIMGYDGRPTGSQLDEKERLMSQLTDAETKIQALLAKELPAANQILNKRGLETIEAIDRDTWMAENSGTAGNATGNSVLLRNKRGRHTLAQLLTTAFGAF